MVGMKRILGLALIGVSVTLAAISSSFGQDNRISIRGSNLEIPRFVTLKTNRVNMRTGPGKNYPIQWEYQRRSLPVKVVGEFDVWRQVTDHDGITGWMHVSTLSLRRVVMILDTTAKIHAENDAASKTRAVAEKGVLAELDYCEPEWCRLEADGIVGWVQRKSLWGILDTENYGQP
jgi:SH3-like domain-containing protein